MRTRAEMVTRLSDHLNDQQLEAFGATKRLRYLEDAALALWDDLLRDTRGERLLTKYGEATALVADQEEYELPAYCARLVAPMVEFRQHDTDTRWTPLAFRRPAPGLGPRSGTALLLGQGAALVCDGWAALYWSDDCQPGVIRIWPALGAVNEEKYRLRMAVRPAFPSADAGTFNDPDASGTALYRLPDRVCEAVEYYAAAMMGTEELEDGRPTGVFGRLYASAVQGILGTASAVRPAREFIRHVR